MQKPSSSSISFEFVVTLLEVASSSLLWLKPLEAIKKMQTDSPALKASHYKLYLVLSLTCSLVSYCNLICLKL